MKRQRAKGNGLWGVAAVVVGLLLSGTPAGAAAVTVVSRTPTAVEVRLGEAKAGTLSRVTYRDGKHAFVWENLAPDASGLVRLTDDRHLRPEQRLRCESRTSADDTVIFDDVTKGPRAGTRRRPFGVPVSTFGGPGYLVPGASDLKRDRAGNFWLFLDRPPYAVLKYDRTLTYQLALLSPDRILTFDLDAAGDVYLLHAGNWLSKHGPLGEPLGGWELPFGRDPGEFTLASGMAIDQQSGFLYLADELLGRVQRFDLNLNLQPIPQTAWGWIGREDLAFAPAAGYDANAMYYRLDRPRQLRLDGKGRLLVSCEHYISQFDLGSGKQLPFGRNPVLGWGGTFSDSVDSPSAALDGHWQRQWLAGVDGRGRIYIGDQVNTYVPEPRLQVFSPEGTVERVVSTQTEVTDHDGRRVYLTAVMGLAAESDKVWLVDAAGRIYESPAGLQSGGKLFLGPGAAGRQFDLSQVEEAQFSVEAQPERARHTSEGRVLALPEGDRGTGNCEREGIAVIKKGEQSMWLPARLGEPFEVKLLAEGKELPASSYRVEYEETPGLFGTQWDFFRVTNASGADWKGVTFVAQAKE